MKNLTEEEKQALFNQLDNAIKQIDKVRKDKGLFAQITEWLKLKDFLESVWQKGYVEGFKDGKKETIIKLSNQN